MDFVSITRCIGFPVASLNVVFVRLIDNLMVVKVRSGFVMLAVFAGILKVIRCLLSLVDKLVGAVISTSVKHSSS